MQQRRFGLTVEGVDKLQAMSVELLELLKANMPHKTGEKSGWNFEKAHSILHKAREIIMFGWTENFSTQGPEHCHIVFLSWMYKQQGCFPYNSQMASARGTRTVSANLAG
jgi:hypothetical protein